eukprot:TRINITY_DN2090_c0_g1_i1.p1 TRINITY_DN2090_c0_g1~~TRINITY_DN2090_c0_g1_i1.p1  ORF type:complete len:257 (+),score=27.72 TRINITY_DN2090_c0_g1_i1:85-771(+)
MASIQTSSVYRLTSFPFQSKGRNENSRRSTLAMKKYRGASTVRYEVPSSAHGDFSETAQGSPAHSQDVNGPKLNKREVLLLTGASAVLPCCRGAEQASAEDGAFATDEVTGKPVSASSWVQTHSSKDRSLTRGIDNQPTYVVLDDGKVASYGIIAICTHLGCTVPWVAEQNKFMCPCHGSQYDSTGAVIFGPAPESLQLVHAEVDNDKIKFTSWPETDFRSGEEPWWI